MKAVQNRKLTKLKQIKFMNCTMANSEWPEISQFSYGASHFFLTEPPHMKDKKLQSKLTELYLSNIRFSDQPMYDRYFSRMCLTNISALTLFNIHPMFVSDLNKSLANGKLPNLSELAISMFLHGNEIDPADQGYGQFRYLEEFPFSFFKEFKPTKLQNLDLSEFPFSAEELQMLSEKLDSLRLLKLSISECSGITGNLSALLTNSFPNLHTLLIQNCFLNADDLQSLARADREGKLPMLKHLDIADYHKHSISNLVINSASWKQLTSLGTCDDEVLSVGSEVFCSVKKLNLRVQKVVPLE